MSVECGGNLPVGPLYFSFSNFLQDWIRRRLCQLHADFVDGGIFDLPLVTIGFAHHKLVLKKIGATISLYPPRNILHLIVAKKE